jgi:hypothetical protein
MMTRPPWQPRPEIHAITNFVRNPLMKLRWFLNHTAARLRKLSSEFNTGGQRGVITPDSVPNTNQQITFIRGVIDSIISLKSESQSVDNYRRYRDFRDAVPSSEIEMVKRDYVDVLQRLTSDIGDAKLSPELDEKARLSMIEFAFKSARGVGVDFNLLYRETFTANGSAVVEWSHFFETVNQLNADSTSVNVGGEANQPVFQASRLIDNMMSVDGDTIQFLKAYLTTNGPNSLPRTIEDALYEHVKQYMQDYVNLNVQPHEINDIIAQVKLTFVRN